MRVLYAQGGQVARGDAIPEAYDALWVDLAAEDEKERAEAVMRQLYPAHPVAVARVLAVASDMRQSLLVDAEAVVFRLSHVERPFEPERQTVWPVGVAFGRRFLLTVPRQGPVPWLESAWRAVMRQNWLAEGADFALYHLLSAHLDHLQALDEAINRRYEAVQETLLHHPYRNLAPDIAALRRWVMWARRLTEPEIEVFTLLGNEGFHFVEAAHRPYFQDLKARMHEIAEDIQSNREGLSGTVEAYTSMQSNEINKVMKFLTIISVLALPATTIASIYGMNFYIPETHWSFGYAYSLAVMAGVTGLLLWLMKRRNWFR